MRNKFDTVYIKNEDVQRQWLLVDASSQYLGRLASRIALMLRGKHKATFQPSVDNGDYIVVINTGKIRMSGRKATTKKHYWYTGFPGGIKEMTAGKMLEDNPDRLLLLAVKRMMPQGKMGRAMLKKLFLYSGETHQQVAQKPILTQVK